MKPRTVIRRALRNAVLASVYAHQAPSEPMFVVGSARSGTTLLKDYLNSHPDITMAGEVLNPKDRDGMRARASPHAALRHIAGILGHLRGPSRGAKLIYRQMLERALDVVDVCHVFPESRWIMIYRESVFDQYVSLRVAMETGAWKSSHPFEGQIVVDELDFKRYTSRTRAENERLLHHLPPSRSVTISYESLVADPASVLAGRIAPLIGIAPWRPASALAKRIGRPLSQVVINWPEVADLATERIRL